MNRTDIPAPQQPNLISCLIQGFDVAANKAGLLLFPFALDLLIWIGPHVHARKLFSTLFAEMNQYVQWPSAELSEQTKIIQDVIIERFNILSALRSFPVGVPSVMSGLLPVGSPLNYPVLDIPYLSSVFLAWLGLTLVGLALGALFYEMVAQAVREGQVRPLQALRRWPWASIQILGLWVVWGLAAIIGVIPFSCLGALGGGALGSLALVLYLGGLCLLLYPLSFAAHAILFFQENVIQGIRRSVVFTRWTLPVTTLVLAFIIIATFSLDNLWRTPAEDSWLMLAGIGGHAFVTTGLLAATFVYFRDAWKWLDALREQMRPA